MKRVLSVLVLCGLVWLVGHNLLALLQRGQRAHLESALPKTEDLPFARGTVHRSSGGAGPVLVLLHGFGDSAAGWSRVADALAAHWTVVAIDLPGHGPSDPATPPLAMADLLAGVEAATADLGDDLTFLGNSLGGWVSLRFATAHPERVRRVMLLNAAGLHQPVDRALLLPVDREHVRLRNVAVFGDHSPWTPDLVCDQLIGLAADPRLDAFWSTLGTEPHMEGELAALGPRTTLIWGLPDPIFPEDYAQRMRAELGAEEPLWLPGCGHSPQYSCPEQLAERVNALRP